MTDATRAELRIGIEAVVRAAMAGAVVDADEWHHRSQTVDGRSYVRAKVLTAIRYPTDEPEPTQPPLPTHKQLALSVLVGEEVPLAVLVSALEDAGVFPAGVLAAVAEKAREEVNAEWLHKVATIGGPEWRGFFSHLRDLAPMTAVPPSGDAAL